MTGKTAKAAPYTLAQLQGSPITIIGISTKSLRTQKARGLRLLGNAGHSLASELEKPSCYKTYVLPHSGIPAPDTEWGRMLAEGHIFARPCPTTPRHGFVDSRVVHSQEEIVDLYNEALAEDPDAELILMPKLEGKYSGVATNAGVTWGFGHDGVTGSKGPTFHIPTPVSPDAWRTYVGTQIAMFKQDVYKKDITDTPYIELVADGKEHVQRVQVRNGPAQASEPDFVPRDVKVHRIIHAQDYPDLIMWEKLMRRISPRKGIVVYPGEHTSLASHYAIHAIQAGIPVITSRPVKIGETLDAIHHSTTQDQDMLRYSNGLLVAYLRAAWDTSEGLANATYATNYLKTCVASLHSMSAWDASDPFLHLRAHAITGILRFTYAALLGEMRHWNDVGPGKRGHDSLMDVECFPIRAGRSQVYREVLLHPEKHSIKKIIECLPSIKTDFEHRAWERGYGGPAWANIAKSALALAKSLERFTRPKKLYEEAPKETWSQVVTRANTCLNTVHNNGKAMSKWMSSEVLAGISICPQIGFMNPTAARMVLKTWDADGVLPPIPTEQQARRYDE